MCDMEGDSSETHFADLPGRKAELTDRSLDIGLSHGLWLRKIEASATHNVDFDHRWRKRGWIDRRVDLPTGMAELRPKVRSP
jgi:hypothetical protein